MLSYIRSILYVQSDSVAIYLPVSTNHNIMQTRLITSLIALLVLTNCDNMFKKIAHNVDPDAKCLDGSPAAILLSEGDPRNILLYFMGGASCEGDSYSKTL